MSNVTLAKIVGVVVGIIVGVLTTRFLNPYIFFLLALLAGIALGILAYRFIVSLVANRTL